MRLLVTADRYWLQTVRPRLLAAEEAFWLHVVDPLIDWLIPNHPKD